MIDEKLHPFTTDHSKCLNCQMRDGEKLVGTNRNSHLCSECQWHLSGLADQIRRDNIFTRELKEIESDLDGIYFDEKYVPNVIESLKNGDTKILDDESKRESTIARLEQIVKLGWSGLIHYD